MKGERKENSYRKKVAGQLGGRWSDQGGTLTKGRFHAVTADLPCQHLLFPDFTKKTILFFNVTFTSRRRWYSGEHSCLPSS